MCAPTNNPHSNMGILSANGAPSAVFYSPPNSPTRKSSICDLSDECIEELFPPTDQELMELEIVDQYVELLAYLDCIEEQESYDPEEFLAMNFQKRWETRRKDRATTRDATRRYAGKKHADGTAIAVNVEDVTLIHPLPKKGHRSRLEQKMMDKGKEYRRGKKEGNSRVSRQPQPKFVQAGMA